MKLFYAVREGVLRQQYITRATLGTGFFHQYVDDTKLSPDVRAALWDCGAASSGSELTVPIWDEERGLWRAIWRSPKECTTGIELVNEWYPDYVASRETAFAARDKALKEAIAELETYRVTQKPGTFMPFPPFHNALRHDEEYMRAYNEVRAWCEEQRAIAAAREAAEEEAYRNEKHAFCTGPLASEDLRRRYLAGYDCDLQYARERAAEEWPGFAVYPMKELAWHYHQAFSPSAAALEEAQRIGGRVVQMDYWNVTLPFGEVVMRWKYLGKFAIFKSVNAD